LFLPTPIVNVALKERLKEILKILMPRVKALRIHGV
jgi:hypothetical protein